MPTDDDYGRRQQQITLHQALQQPSQSQQLQPASICPAGCPSLGNGSDARYSPTTPPMLNGGTSAPTCAGGGGNVVEKSLHASDLARFIGERSHSDRLPSGERYPCALERYPLGGVQQAAISSERLHYYTERGCSSRYGDRTERYQQQQQQQQLAITTGGADLAGLSSMVGVGSLERYYNGAQLEREVGREISRERYSRTSTPTDRYLGFAVVNAGGGDERKERCSSSTSDRYMPEKYERQNERHERERDRRDRDRHSSTQSVCSDSASRRRLDAYAQHGSKTLPPEIYKYNKERSVSATRYQSGGPTPSNASGVAAHHSQQQQQHASNRYEPYISFGERFPPIPCPERFATSNGNAGSNNVSAISQQQSQVELKFTTTQVPYMEPPSPAPAGDRFIPPPPLSPSNTPPSPEACYPSQPFPSPTPQQPDQQRFIPPPPLSPSPTDAYAKTLDRYEKSKYSHHHHQHKDSGVSHRFPASSPNQDRFYAQQAQQSHRSYYTSDRLTPNFADGVRYGDRYVPPNAHTPVERYVPQPHQQPQQPPPPQLDYASYHQFYAATAGSAGTPQKFATAQDPYLRRDLAFHYRLPVPYPQYAQPGHGTQRTLRYVGTPNRIKCCASYQEGYQLSKSSPGSSSSSSVTSHGKDSSMQDIQCQNYLPTPTVMHQEKGIQCNKDVQCSTIGVSAMRSKPSASGVAGTSGQCRHGICASPSVEYMGASGGRLVNATPPPRSSIGSTDGGSVCNDPCCGRKSTQPQTQASLSVAVWRVPSSSQHQPLSQSGQSSSNQPQTITKLHTPSPAGTTHNSNEQLQEQLDENVHSTSQKASPLHRVLSLPAPSLQQQPGVARQLNYSQSERNPHERPRLMRSQSKKEVIKNYIKRETATFFGVCEDNLGAQERRWLERRKRMAKRTYSTLKDDSELPEKLRRRLRGVSEIRTRSVPPQAGQLQMDVRPDVLPGPSDVADASDANAMVANVEEDSRRKDSVARMTWDGLSYIVTTLTRHNQRDRPTQTSRSYPPDVPSGRLTGEESLFFGRPHSGVTPAVSPDAIDRDIGEVPLRHPHSRGVHLGWRRDPHHISRNEHVRHIVGGTRICAAELDRALDNSDRRQYGMGWVGKMFGRSMRRTIAQDPKVRSQLDDMEDYRPMFTYWVTTVQILVMIISIICYGIGPFGLDMQARSGQVLVTSLSLQQVDYREPANFWFGPRAADLIHLGAKFSPCMRIDNKIIQQIEKTRAKERETACCIRNDDSGCVQSSQADCSKTISTWKKWSAGESGPGGRISGSVCGLDPKFCDAPASVHPYEWPDDITKWPICRKTNTQSSIQKRGPRDRLAEHMVCEVIGHPCCIGIHGQCRITTREYCDFVRGKFHEEANLCSQVSCLNDVCGMIPFYFFEIPDQFYRLWTSLFLHAGVLQLAITLFIQYFLMRDLEKLTGSLRIGIIYVGSGVAGNLASAIFVPYRADVGPSGSQFGLLACLIVEVLNAWPLLRHPNQALCKLLTITVALFALGLLPWVDNYAHLFGFVFGFLLSYALMPFVSFGTFDRHKKVLLIWMCLLAALFLFTCLVLLFYVFPVYDCKLCAYFNCLPLTADFCAAQNINFMREEPVV